MQDLHKMPKYFSLNYSKRQHGICLKHDEKFKPNTYKGKPYTEMTTGQTPDECKSNFDDADVVLAGEIGLFHKVKSDIKYL